MRATDRFADVVARAQVPLDEAALCIAAHGDPSCDIDRQLGRLDDLAASLGRLGGTGLDGLVDSLFGPDGLRGNHDDYGDPQNSYLHRVLDRRLGIPISLSVVLVELGRRVGLDLAGVGTPGHFLVRTVGEPAVFVDAFDGGRRMDRRAVLEHFARRTPGVDVTSHLGPVGATAIVRRMLNNLANSFVSRNDRAGLVWAAELRTLLPEAGDDDVRALAGATAAAGDFARAASLLETLDTTTEDVRHIARLRAKLN